EIHVLSLSTSDLRVIQERLEKDVIFRFLVNGMNVLVQQVCGVYEKNKKPALRSGGTSCKKRKLRKLSKMWIMMRKSWRKGRLVGYLGNNEDMKMIKEAMHQINKGECSYSAYMGNSLEGRMDVRGQETTGADDPITRNEWNAFVEYIKALAATKRHGTSSISSKPIIIDSAASHHLISDRSLITDVKPTTGSVMIANRDRIPIEGVGNLKLFEKNSAAFYLRQFTSNLISLKRATVDLDCQVVFRPNEVEFQDLKTGQIIGRGDSKNELYHLQTTKIPKPFNSVCLSSTTDRIDSITWHARLGHPHARAIELILPTMSFNHLECEACILGKHCRTVFPASETIYDHCFDLVHSDVWTSPCVSRDSQKYFVTFIDEKSKYTWITLLPSKDRVSDAFVNFQAYVTNHYNAT